MKWIYQGNFLMWLWGLKGQLDSFGKLLPRFCHKFKVSKTGKSIVSPLLWGWKFEIPRAHCWKSWCAKLREPEVLMSKGKWQKVTQIYEGHSKWTFHLTCCFTPIPSLLIHACLDWEWSFHVESKDLCANLLGEACLHNGLDNPEFHQLDT